ncbi:beige/beach-related [Anaeramoeba flamelloides]|uniref:Beige/beach-related n=1 Tax=Anaeramoeba flamelloides TaxID=1746091 RepID=A0AAV7ZCB8_9EUKA|nr:beige/beach-related [Anaeramoeba flamelloides]
MSFLKRVFKKKSIKIEHFSLNQSIVENVFSSNFRKDPISFTKHQTLGKELSNLWELKKKQKTSINCVNWYCSFSNCFIDAYANWSPTNRRVENIFNRKSQNKKTTKKKQKQINNNFSQEIKKDNAHPTELIVYTLRNLLYIRQTFLNEFEIKSDINVELFQEKVPLPTLAICLEMISLLARSKLNLMNFIEYGLIECLVSLSEIIGLFLEKFSQELRKFPINEKNMDNNEKKQENEKQKTRKYINITEKYNTGIIFIYYFLMKYSELITLISKSQIWENNSNKKKSIEKNENELWISNYNVIQPIISISSILIQLSTNYLLPGAFCDLQIKCLQTLISIRKISDQSFSNCDEDLILLLCNVFHFPNFNLPSAIMFPTKEMNETQRMNFSKNYFYNFYGNSQKVINNYNQKNPLNSEKNKTENEKKKLLEQINDIFIEYLILTKEKYQQNLLNKSLLSLELMRISLINNITFEKKLAENPNFSKLCDLLLWISITFIPKEIKTYKKQNKQIIIKKYEELKINRRKVLIEQLKDDKQEHELQGLAILEKFEVGSFHGNSKYRAPKLPLPKKVPLGENIQFTATNKESTVKKNNNEGDNEENYENYNEIDLENKTFLQQNPNLEQFFSLLKLICEESTTNWLNKMEEEKNNENNNSYYDNNENYDEQQQGNQEKFNSIEKFNEFTNTNQISNNSDNKNNKSNNNANNSSNNKSAITRSNRINTVFSKGNRNSKIQGNIEIKHKKTWRSQRSWTGSIKKISVKHSIVCICLDLFQYTFHKSLNTLKARDFIKTIYPGLQLHVLNFFFDIIDFDILNQIRKQFWETLLTPFFYPEINHDFIGHQESVKLFKYIKKLLFQFIYYTVIELNYEYNNIQETQTLINLLKNNHCNLYVILDISKILIKIFQLNLNQLKMIILQTNGISVFTNILNNLYKIHKLFKKNFKKTLVVNFSSEIFYKTRYLTFSVLDHIMFLQDIYQQIVSEPTLINLLMELMLEPQVKDYALNKIITLMLATPINPQIEWGSLYISFVDIINFLTVKIKKLIKKVNSTNQNQPRQNTRVYNRSNSGNNSKYNDNDNNNNIIIKNNRNNKNKNNINIDQLSNIKNDKDNEKDNNNEKLNSLIQLTQDLLISIRNTILQNPHSLPNYLTKAGIYQAFENILEIFQLGNQLKMIVLQTLLQLLKNNRNNIKLFKKEIGYDKLSDYLFIVQNKRYNEQIHNILLNMLVKDGKFNIENNFIIYNYEIILTIFSLTYKFTNKKHFQDLLNLFITICQRSIHNTQCCCQAGLVSFLCNLIPSLASTELSNHTVQLLGIIGSHSMTVKELQTFFDLLTPIRGIFRSKHFPLILNSFEKMTKKDRNGPKVFFDFNGRSACLDIPEIDSWPIKGYSFCTWIRIESLNNPNIQFNEQINNNSNNNNNNNNNNNKNSSNKNINRYEPRLFSFLDHKGQGIELFLVKQQNLEDIQVFLVVKLIHKDHFEEFSTPLKIPPLRWFSLSITQSNSNRKTNKKREIKLYINGKLENKKVMNYPTIKFPYKYNRIGSNYKVNNLINNLKREYYFYGQMGVIYFFNDSLSDNQMENIYNLGPNYMGTFEKPIDLTQIENKNSENNLNSNNMDNVNNMSNMSNNEHNSSNNINNENTKINNQFLNGILTEKIFLCYNSRACDEKFCYDQSPFVLKNRNGKLNGMFQSNSKDLFDIIHCLGGFKIFFPLIIQLDSPEYSKTNLLLFEQNLTKFENNVNTQLSSQLLEMISNMIISSKVNQEDMIRSQGSVIIRYLFQKLNPENFTKRSILILKELFSELTNNLLLKKLFKNIILNFDIWIYCSFEVQEYLIKLIDSLIKLQKFEKIIKFQILIDIVNRYYWLEAEIMSKIINENKIHFLTNQIFNGKRPNKETIIKLRNLFFNTLQGNILLTINNKEDCISKIVSIINTIYCLKGETHILDFIELLIYLFQNITDELIMERILNMKIFVNLIPYLLTLKDIGIFKLTLKLFYTIRTNNLLKVNNKKLQLKNYLFQSEEDFFSIHHLLLLKKTNFNLLYLFLLFNLTENIKIDFSKNYLKGNHFFDENELINNKENKILLQKPWVLKTLFNLIGQNSKNKNSLNCLIFIKNILTNSPENLEILIKQNEIRYWIISNINLNLLKKLDNKMIMDMYIINSNNFKIKNEKIKLTKINENEKISLDITLIFLEILNLIHFYKFEKLGIKAIEKTIILIPFCLNLEQLNKKNINNTNNINNINNKNKNNNNNTNNNNNNDNDNNNEINYKEYENMLIRQLFVLLLNSIQNQLQNNKKNSKKRSSSIVNEKKSFIDNFFNLLNSIINYINFKHYFIDSEKLVNYNIDNKINNIQEINNLKKKLKYGLKVELKFKKLNLFNNAIWEDLFLIDKIIKILDQIGFFEKENKKYLKEKNTNRNFLSEIILFMSSIIQIDCLLNFQKVVEKLIFIIQGIFQGSNPGNLPPKHRPIASLLFLKLINLLSFESEKELPNSQMRQVLLCSLVQQLLYSCYPYFQKLIKLKSTQTFLDENRDTNTLLKLKYLDFIKMIKQIGFQSILVEIFQPIQEEIIKENLLSGERYIKEKRVLLKTTLNNLEKEIYLNADLIKNLNRNLFNSTNNNKAFEQERIDNYNLKLLKKSHLGKKLWTNLIRTLEEERGYSFNDKNDGTGNENEHDNVNVTNNNNNNNNTNNDGNNKANIYWELNNTEDSLRRRMKLKRNYDYDSHYEASVRRDLKNKEQSDKVITEWQIKLSNQSQKILGNIQNLFIVDQTEEIENEMIEEIELEELEELEESIKKKIILQVNCQLITPLKITKGVFELTPKTLNFKPELSINLQNNNKEMEQQQSEEGEEAVEEEKSWELKDLIELHRRRYHLRPSGLEFFLIDKTNFFINFDQKNDTNKAYWRIISLKPINLVKNNVSSQKNWIKKSNYTKMWRKRKISNFEYLMKLNTIAGRSYNDISQYPIFPWILSDYTSESIDLNDPKVYRDLSKPMGALNEDRKLKFIEKYKMFAEQAQESLIPPFHYGTHYSSAAVVLYYLIRLEPFTSLGIKLQGGKFDRSDRMFHSIPETFYNCLTNPSDVKELIPEFFYLSEFLENSNNYDLGKKQNGEKLNDIILPPWAKTPEEFIRINRLALESDYVSEHLHEWIDLIFGFKQKGDEAIKAVNVFYYLTYENAVDIDQIEDPMERKSIEDQIENFGQTPTQLFLKPHPKRLSKNEIKNHDVEMPLVFYHNEDDLVNEINKSSVKKCKFSNSSIIYIWISDLQKSLTHSNSYYKIIAFDQERNFIFAKYHHNISNNPNNYSGSSNNNLKNNPNNNSNNNPNNPNNNSNNTNMNSLQENSFMELEQNLSSQKRRKIGVSFTNKIENFNNCFNFDNSGKYFYSCGHWDYSVKLSNSDNNNLIQTIKEHKDVVTCLALDRFNQSLLATGSKDTTVIIWEINKKRENAVVQSSKKILYGHNDEITSVDIHSDLDIVASANKSGICIIHSLRAARFIRSFKISDGNGNKKKQNKRTPKKKNNSATSANAPISMLKISNDGNILIYSDKIRVYSINGRLIQTAISVHKLTCWQISHDDQFLITGSEKGIITVRYLHNLKLIKNWITGGVITTLHLSKNHKFILAGFKSGDVFINEFIIK